MGKESSNNDACGTGKMGTDNFSRAMAHDDTALFLSAVESFRGWLPKGSEASSILGQEMSNKLLRLACRHDAVECARLLLDGGKGITASLVDARDHLLMRTPLHIAAETHSARCIQLLLSRNARTDLRVVYGRPLVPLEVALMSRRFQVDWSPESSVEDLLAYLKQMDLSPVRILAEKTREVGEVAYRYAMEGHAPELAMLLLVAEDKLSGTVNVVINGVRTKRSIYNSLVDEVLSIGYASAQGSNGRRKTFLCVIQLLNHFRASSWRDPNSQANPKAQNPRKQRPIDVATSQDIHIILNSATSVNNGSLETNHAIKRKRCEELSGGEFIDSNDEVQTSCTSSTQLLNQWGDSSWSNRNIDRKSLPPILRASKELSNIYVSSPQGLLPIRICLDEQVIALKYLIAEKFGYPVLGTTLRVGCKIFYNAEKLSSYGLCNNSVVEMYIKLLGGQPPTKKLKASIDVYDVTLEAFAERPDPDRPLPALVETKYISGTREDNKADESHDVSPIGRRFGKLIVKEFKKAKDARRTWRGQIGLRDFRARNGELVLNKPSELVPRLEWKHEWKKDCAAEAKIFKALFMKDGKKTPYMEYLIQELENAEPQWGWGIWFCRFQTTNLAFKPSHRRLHAPQDIWRFFENLKTKDERQKFIEVLDKVIPPEVFTEYKRISKIPAFIPTLAYHIKEHKKVYDGTSLGCLLLTRNYGTHGKLLDWLHTEIAIPMVLGDFISRVIKAFLQSGYDFGAALDDE